MFNWEAWLHDCYFQVGLKQYNVIYGVNILCIRGYHQDDPVKNEAMELVAAQENHRRPLAQTQ